VFTVAVHREIPQQLLVSPALYRFPTKPTPDLPTSTLCGHTSDSRQQIQKTTESDSNPNQCHTHNHALSPQQESAHTHHPTPSRHVPTLHTHQTTRQTRLTPHHLPVTDPTPTLQAVVITSSRVRHKPLHRTPHSTNAHSAATTLSLTRPTPTALVVPVGSSLNKTKLPIRKNGAAIALNTDRTEPGQAVPGPHFAMIAVFLPPSV